MKSTKIFLLAGVLAVMGCGDPEPQPVDDEMIVDDEDTVVDDTDDEVDDADDEEPVDMTEDPVDDPIEEVTVDCVSNLVTGNGNYYALTAQVAEAGTTVEMVQYYASTPTSDPVEAEIFADVVEAEFTPRLFAFQTDEVFLDVERAEGEAYYRGTMSGQTQFADEVTVTCWPADIQRLAAYDAASGDCLDDAGNPATNDIPWMVAVRTGFGQCTKFEGILNQDAFNYPTFDFVDLRGADFSDAELSFADIVEAQWEGANLLGFDYGYATIGGSIDEHTQLPEMGDCAVDEDATEFSCTR